MYVFAITIKEKTMKDKEIKEMAKIIMYCPFIDADSQAKELYEQGYRKIPKNAVVIPEKITEETSAETLIKIAKYNEKVRKEMAKEVIEKFISQIEFRGIATMDGGNLEYFKISGLGLREIAREQFGVEVE